jgi:Predicted membrane protein
MFILRHWVKLQQRDAMKENIFYLIIGFVALLLLAVFWYSVENFTPLFSMVAFIAGVLVIYMAYRRVEDYIEDERSARITEKAALRTFQVFWVCFCTFSIMAVMNMLYMPRISRETLVRPPVPAGIPGDHVAENDRVYPAGTSLPDDLPVRGIQALLRQKIRRMGDR